MRCPLPGPFPTVPVWFLGARLNHPDGLWSRPGPVVQDPHDGGRAQASDPLGNANLNPWTQAKVNTTNPGRGPLLIIDGEKDHTVPWAIANAAYKRQRRNPTVTEIVKIPNRGHSLTIDHGWREVAQTALDFVNRFA